MNGDVAKLVDVEIALAPVADLIGLQSVQDFPLIHQLYQGGASQLERGKYRADTPQEYHEYTRSCTASSAFEKFPLRKVHFPRWPGCGLRFRLTYGQAGRKLEVT